MILLCELTYLFLKVSPHYILSTLHVSHLSAVCSTKIPKKYHPYLSSSRFINNPSEHPKLIMNIPYQIMQCVVDRFSFTEFLKKFQRFPLVPNDG